MNNEEKTALIYEYINAYNRFDVDAMLACVSEDVSFENIQDNQLSVSSNGKAALKALAEQSSALFSERQQKIEAIEHKPEISKVRIRFYAKLAIDLPNGAKAGDELTLKGMSEFVFSDGFIRFIRDMS